MKMTWAYFNLMSHWLEGAIIGYLGNDSAKYKVAIEEIKARQKELFNLGAKKDDWDYKGLEDCTNLLEFLTRYQTKLVERQQPTTD